MGRRNAFKLDVVSVRLSKETSLFSDKRIACPEDAINAVSEFLCEMDREVVCVINLNTDGTPINCHVVSIGAVNYALVEPRELLKSTILSNASSMIMVHNHPGGSLKPSREDTKITDRLLQISSLIGISLMDHIIIGRDDTHYFSFKEKGLINRPRIDYTDNYEYLDFDSSVKVAAQGKGR